MDSKITPITHFGDSDIKLPDSIKNNIFVKQLWEMSSDNFRKGILQPIIEDMGKYEDKDSISMAVTIQPLLELRQRGISEDELEELEPWEYSLFSKTQLSFDDYCESRDANGITSSTKCEDALVALNGSDFVLKEKLSDSEYATYLLMRKYGKIPEWVVDIPDIILFMRICTHFRVGDDRVYLNNVKYLTKEDALFLDKQRCGDLFGCLCLKPLYGQENMMVSSSWMLAAGYNLHRYKPLQWLRIDTPRDSTTIPIYSYYKNREWLENKLTLKTISDIVISNEGNQLVIGINEYEKPCISRDYEPSYSLDVCDRDCEDPVLVISRNILSAFGVKANFSDFTIHSKAYFIFLEVAAGSEDWLKALDSNSFEIAFMYYQKGDSLADALWRLLSKRFSLNYSVKKTRRSVGKVRIQGEYYSLYDLMGDGSKLITAIQKCPDSTKIEVY